MNRIGRIAMVAVAVALSVAGCAGGAGKKVSADSSGLLPVKIGYTAPGAGYSDLYTAADYGIFKKHGLNVQLVRLNTSSQLVASLASNSVQIGVGVAQDSAAAILKGAPLRFVAMSEPHYNLEMWAGPGIKTVQDLRGKKVAISSPGSESDFGLTALLNSKGMQRGDVQTEFVQGIPAEVAALDSGSVQAILTQPPNGTQSRDHGATRLAALSNLDFALGTYTVESAYLANNRDVVTKFVQADAEALQFLRSHPQQTEQSIEKYTGVTSSALAQYAYTFFINVWAQTPTVDENLIAQAFKNAATTAHVSPPANVSQYIDNLGGSS
ncbi:MAG TPA: ABC transporter substrate-binding protein [Pseudonocardiaceae bacterium]|jgi:NitT/TauT family transport system substrate-binding protein|nr:ABC transporter substrate-binding protein [Pseudonocardiaceae bacterium]